MIFWGGANKMELRFKDVVILGIVAALMAMALASLSGCTTGGEVSEPSQPTVVVTKKPDLSKRVLLWGTHYYAHVASEVTSGVGYPLYSKAGVAVSPKISQKEYCLCGIEGTCSINGQVYDWGGVGTARVPFTCSYKGHQAYWSKGTYKYGKGNKNNALEPFVSIAADQSIYPFGTVIYVPQALGVKLPDGSLHKGFFKVADVGGAIKGNHIDVFTIQGFKFPFVKSSSSATFEAYIQ